MMLSEIFDVILKSVFVVGLLKKILLHFFCPDI